MHSDLAQIVETWISPSPLNTCTSTAHISLVARLTLSFLVFVPALILIFLSAWRIHRLYAKSRAIKPWSHLPLSGKALLAGKAVLGLLVIAAQAWWIGATVRAGRGSWWSAWMGTVTSLIASVSIHSATYIHTEG